MNIPSTATSSLQLRPTARPERRAVNGTATVARRVTYDDLGRTVSVVRGGKAGAIDYTYNVRGLLTSIVSPGLEMRLHYNDGPGTARWDGMISAMTWKCPDRERRRGYLFTYNSQGWLTDAVYGENDAVTTNPNRYSERVTSYTLNGAIRRLQRHGLKDNGVYGKIDNLNITLEGNRVVAMTDDAAPLLRAGSTDFADGSDTTAEYTYNGVGALTSDANRGITLIEYDNLNHPRRVSFRNGHTVEWVYAPDGTRLRAIHTTAVEGVSVAPGMRSEPDAAHIVRRDTTDYSAGVTWGPGNRLERVEIPGGYATIGAGGVPRYHYYTADHVGNNRVVVSEDGVIEQVVHYYPFGGQYADAGLNLSAQQYKHGGKELDPAYGLDWHDFGARPYYAPLAAWLHPDRMAHLAPHLSPYRYCFNNPVNFIDRNGLFETKQDALNAAKQYNNAEVLMDRASGEWFISLNAEGNAAYTSGPVLTRYFGDKKLSLNSALFLFGVGISSKKEIQYSEYLEIWTGRNHKTYYGLSGRGPNQHTGSRILAKYKSKKFGHASYFLTGVSMYMTYTQYVQDTNKELGPNMRHYLHDKYIKDQTANFLGAVGGARGTAVSIGYNLGYLIEDLGQWMTNNPDFRIRINPYTLDFTPIEKTLQEYDELGIIVY